MEMRSKIIIYFVLFTKSLIVRWQWSWSRANLALFTISACFSASELTLFAREFTGFLTSDKFSKTTGRNPKNTHSKQIVLSTVFLC